MLSVKVVLSMLTGHCCILVVLIPLSNLFATLRMEPA